MRTFIATMLILRFSIYMIQKQTKKPDIGEEISKQARYLIKETSHDEQVRNAVMGRNSCAVKSFFYKI